MAQRKDVLGGSPAQIRAAIARARDDLGAHLGALWKSQPFTHGETQMPTQAKPKRAATKNEKPAAKAEGSKKPAAGKAMKKRASKPVAESMITTAGHVIDEMAAGAVVGAVKAAAQAIDEKEAKTLKGKHKPTTGEVLGEMGSDAAVGAIVGAAKSVMPAEDGKAKGTAPKKASGAKRK